MTRKILVVLVVAMFAVVGCKKKDDKGKKKPTPAKNVKKDPPKKDPKAQPKTDPKKDPAKTAEAKPEVALLVIHKVKDFKKWMSAFHAHYKARKAAGIMGHFVARGANNDKLVVVYLPAANKEKLEAFTKDPALKKAMAEAGVDGKPQFQWMTPVSNDTNSDPKKKLAGVVVTHKVADFDKWKKAYDAADEMRKKHGITGHAVERMVKKPNTVVVYHEAEKLETLKAFLKLPELGKAMKAAGVEGKPSFMYIQGEHQARYKADDKK